jgi:hypothetical protein
MKNLILPTLALAAASLSTNTQAQQNKAFAITSETKGAFSWNVVRQIDLTTGEVTKTFYDQAVHKNFELVNTQSARITPPNNRFDNAGLMPMGQGVAAAAYDAKHNRLYYTCMRGTDLRYFDLNSSTGKVVYNQTKTLFDGNRFDEANVITRMTFAADGNGYALTNDGKHLIRFTTDQKSSITDVGELIDGKKNGAISVHNQCSSWGGDMVGDAYGNLYLVTMRNNIFKINPQTRIADYIGQVKGLPAEFTSNGMVVNDDGELVISSAAVSNSYYKVNISTLQATAIKNSGDHVYNSSDLANSNLLYDTKLTTTKSFNEVRGNYLVSVYPNPVATRSFSIQLDDVASGNYNVVLTDPTGRNIISRALKINSKGQVEKINLARGAASGMYLIKLTGENGKILFTDKLVVE